MKVHAAMVKIGSVLLFLLPKQPLTFCYHISIDVSAAIPDLLNFATVLWIRERKDSVCVRSGFICETTRQSFVFDMILRPDLSCYNV